MQTMLHLYADFQKGMVSVMAECRMFPKLTNLVNMTLKAIVTNSRVKNVISKIFTLK